MMKHVLYLFLAFCTRSKVAASQYPHVRGGTTWRLLQDFGACISQLAAYEDCVNEIGNIQVGTTCTECVDDQLPVKASFDFCKNFGCQDALVECGCTDCVTEATNFLMCIFGCADDLCPDTAYTLAPSLPPFPETPPSSSPTHLSDPPSSAGGRNTSCDIQECVRELQACLAPCEQEQTQQECSIETCVDTFNACAAPCLV